MRALKLILSSFMVIVSMNAYTQSDTAYTRIDTLVCDDFVAEYFFQSPYDQLQYSSAWDDLINPLLMSDSIRINDLDSVILYSTPINTSQSVLVDTIIISLRFRPQIDFDIPALECFNGDSLSIIDRSIFDLQYTEVSYLDPSGNLLTPQDSLINVAVGNGEILTITANYFIQDCNEPIDTSFELATRFSPESVFNFTEVCSGDSTVVNNQSLFDRDSADFSLTIDNIASYDESQDSFIVLLPNNPDNRSVFVEISESGCTTRDTFMISNKLNPSAGFDIRQVCENELLVISNMSSGINLNSEYSVSVAGFANTYSSASEFTLSDTLPDGSYPLMIIVDNRNGCVAEFNIDVDVDSVTYVSFDNLDSSYCTSEESEILVASVAGGLFSGPFVNDLGNGEGVFLPAGIGANIPIKYTYTNLLSCTDSITQSVDTVFASPVIELSGLNMAYCAMDMESILKVNQSIENNSTYEVWRDGTLIGMQTSLTYEFDPIIAGSYEILNVYESVDGCIDSLMSMTIVNALPMVTLDSVSIITPSDVISIGNTSMPEPNVEYLWSNGSESATIEVDQPGIYIINAINVLTGCIGSDTISIKYDIDIETDLVKIQLSPNPTMDIVNISTSEPVQDIRLINVFGEEVNINGQSLFSTDQLGMLSIDMSNQESGYYYILIPNLGSFLLLKI